MNPREISEHYLRNRKYYNDDIVALADDYVLRINELEVALKALHDSVDRFVIATDDVDVRGAMCLAKKALARLEARHE